MAFGKLPIEPSVEAGNSFMFSLKARLRDISKALNPIADWAEATGAYFVSGVLQIVNGGTGASTAAGARTNLGSTTTGDALFTSASASAARTTIGLGNVDNTSDANKPVSTAQAAADSLRVLKSGDTMTGSLVIPTAVDLTTTSGMASVLFHTTSAGGAFIGAVDGQTGGQVNIRYAGGAATAQFQSGGNFQVPAEAYKPTGGSWIASSDARLKENVTDYTHGLREVLALRPVTFNFSAETGLNDALVVGLIAQEAEGTMPEMVEIKPGVMGSIALYDMRFLNSGPLVYALTNAVKELQQQIDTIRAEVRALKP